MRDATGRVSAPTSIDDPDDPRVAEYRALNDAALRRAIEGADVCIAEGSLVVERLLRTSFAVRSFLVSDRRWQSLGPLATALEAHPAPTYLASQAVMNQVAGFDIHRGVLASATRPVLLPPVELLDAAVVVAVLEGVNDHENMGVIFRNAGTLGVDAIVLDSTADPLYRRAIRVDGSRLRGAVHPVRRSRRARGFTLVAYRQR